MRINRSKGQRKVKKTLKKKAKGKKETIITATRKIGNKKNLPGDLTRKLTQIVAASRLQHQVITKIINRISDLLNEVDFIPILMSFEKFIDDIKTTYEFNQKKTPIYMLQLNTRVEEAMEIAYRLEVLKNNIQLLKTIYQKMGPRNLERQIENSIRIITSTFEKIQEIEVIAKDKYRIARLNLHEDPEHRVVDAYAPPWPPQRRFMTRKTRSA